MGEQQTFNLFSRYKEYSNWHDEGQKQVHDNRTNITKLEVVVINGY